MRTDCPLGLHPLKQQIRNDQDEIQGSKPSHCESMSFITGGALLSMT